MSETLSEITLLLQAAGEGDAGAGDRAFALLYTELRQMARSRLRQSGELTLLDTTVLVHESYLRLQGQDGAAFPDRAHFLAYASRVMRTVVVDVVRARLAERRGGGAEHLPLDTALGEQLAAHDEEVLRVHEALDELAALEPRLAQVVELRYFGGLTEAEIAVHLDITERTVQRDWAKARLFLSMSLR
jgi:RNA polymerase sigma factor (TIGR02999 family)